MRLLTPFVRLPTLATLLSLATLLTLATLGGASPLEPECDAAGLHVYGWITVGGRAVLVGGASAPAPNATLLLEPVLGVEPVDRAALRAVRRAFWPSGSVVLP